MTEALDRLLNYRANVYSQNGEDGVLSELLRRLELPPASRYCVEFGAWDGKHLSNTFELVSSQGWNAVYIESDPSKFADLVTTAMEHRRIHPVNALVGRSGAGVALDDILAETSVPVDFDLLSIDIDSSDLEVWAEHNQYRPKIVVIEINSSVVPGVLQWHSARLPGNSFSSTLIVARWKGYELVCHTGNLIFVRHDLAERVGLDPLDRQFPERLFLSNCVNAQVNNCPNLNLRKAFFDFVRRAWRRQMA